MVQNATTSTILLLALAGLAFGPMTRQIAGVETLIDFRSAARGDWNAVNDDVMGGRSSSSMRLTSDGSAVFEGEVSLDNNGGFASVRTEVPVGALEGFSRLCLHSLRMIRQMSVSLSFPTEFLISSGGNDAS